MSLLEVDGVTKKFGGVTAVNEVSLEVEEHSVTALIGPNGAGKTTLFNMITCFEPTNSGVIRFEGVEMQKKKPWQVSRSGMVRTFQTPVGFPKLTIWENLLVSAAKPRDESLASALLGPRRWRKSFEPIEERAEEVLVELGLWERRDVIIEDLSVGENKLVEFARQLINGPKLLMLDEPASGVDPVNIGKLKDLILKLRGQGITVLVIDHNLSFILSIADKVYVLSEGALIAQGPPAEISKDPKVIEIYLGKSAATVEAA